MHATFIAASDGTPLTKTFSLQPGSTPDNPSFRILPYPLVTLLDSFEEEYEDLFQFEALLRQYAEANCAMLLGRIFDGPLAQESRAGRVPSNQPLQLIVFDIDKIKAPIGHVREALGLTNVTHIVQYSASFGIKDTDTLSAHFFALASSPFSPEQLKQWLLNKNIHDPFFRNQLSLTSSKTALHYPLDICTAQPTRVIYIAPPRLEGIEDPLGDKRIELYRGTRDTFHLAPIEEAYDIAEAERVRRALIDQQRANHNLPPMDHASTSLTGYDAQKWQVLKNPEHMAVHLVGESNGFTRVNLNDGDSNAYFFPSTNPKILYNFKEEPALPLEKINPRFYAQAKERARELQREEREREERADLERAIERADQMYEQLRRPVGERRSQAFYFTDEVGKYRTGFYDADDNVLKLFHCSNRKQVEDFATQFDLPEPVVIPSMEVVFEPREMGMLLEKGPSKRFNLYSPSPYLLRATPTGISVPPTIRQLLFHILGNDEGFFDHFINWLAYMLQYKEKPGTAFLFHGTTGTGKGTLFHHILLPMFGPQQVTVRRLDQFEDNFDGELMHAQILWIDEASLDKLSNGQKVFDKLNNYISEEEIPIRRMYRGHDKLKTYMGVLVGTNAHNAVRIDYNDRRWNIPPRQEVQLRDIMPVGEVLHEALANQLQNFTNYLMAYKVRVDDVKRPLDSRAKEEVQGTTTDTPLAVANAIRAGDFEFFVDCLPDHMNKRAFNEAAAEHPPLARFFDSLSVIYEAIVKNAGEVYLTRQDLSGLFEGTVGWPPETQAPVKFTKKLRHYGIHLQRVQRQSLRLRAVYPTTFHATPATLDYFARRFGATEPYAVK